MRNEELHMYQVDVHATTWIKSQLRMQGMIYTWKDPNDATTTTLTPFMQLQTPQNFL